MAFWTRATSTPTVKEEDVDPHADVKEQMEKIRQEYTNAAAIQKAATGTLATTGTGAGGLVGMYPTVATTTSPYVMGRHVKPHEEHINSYIKQITSILNFYMENSTCTEDECIKHLGAATTSVLTTLTSMKESIK